MDRQMEQEIQRYLSTGEHDPGSMSWRGQTVIECQRNGHAAMKAALITEVEKRSAGRAPAADAPIADLGGFTRNKLRPMICGLFPRREQEAVLKLLEHSVVFLTPTNIASILQEERWLHTAWSLANLFLASIDADLLSPDAPRIVGLSEETTCYVSPEYFAERDRFADFLIHEAAHVFHNCKRQTAGLPETRTREWLLDIAFRKRETFAYACEAYSRILELGRTPTDRRRLLGEFETEGLAGDETVHQEELILILGEAVAARNGWKRILARCAPLRKPARGPEQVGKSIPG